MKIPVASYRESAPRGSRGYLSVDDDAFSALSRHLEARVTFTSALKK